MLTPQHNLNPVPELIAQSPNPRPIFETAEEMKVVIQQVYQKYIPEIVEVLKSVEFLDKNNPSTPEGQAFTRLHEIVIDMEKELRESGVMTRYERNPLPLEINMDTSEINTFISLLQATNSRRIDRVIFTNRFRSWDGGEMFGEGHTRADSWELGFHNPFR